MSPSVSTPETYPRRVLLSVSGLSPQVVTETLYHLCCVRKPAFVPTEVHVITTREGKATLELALLHERSGKFHAFLKDYGLEGKIEFTAEDVFVMADRSGNALEDVRTTVENDAAADYITAHVRQITADQNCAIHFSIAGGRNTMGLYMGYALSLFGRPQDRLSHVLVPEEFQHNHGFYYPPPTPQVVVSHSNRLLDTSQATITLADIPYVSMRHFLSPKLLEGDSSYTDTVAAARRSLDPPSIQIDTASKTITCGGHLVSMPPQLFAWYTWMAQRCKQHGPKAAHVRWTDDGIAKEFLSVYRRVVGEMAHDFEAASNVLADGMTQVFFQEKKARVNSWLREELKLAAAPYLICAIGRKPMQKFGLEIPSSAIVIS